MRYNSNRIFETYFSELTSKSEGSAAKRSRDDSIGGDSIEIEPTPKKPRESDTESDADTEPEAHREAHANTESEAEAEIDVNGSLTSVILERDSERDSRMSVCLRCGTYIRGTHANVSYCFSDHMCNGTPDQNQFSDAICIIANAMHYSEFGYTTGTNAASTPNSSNVFTHASDVQDVSSLDLQVPPPPFNAFNIGRALNEIRVQYQNAENSV